MIYVMDNGALREVTDPAEIQEIADREAEALQMQLRANSEAMADYLATVRDLREQILNRLAGIGMGAIVAQDQATLDACAAARLRLLNITTTPAAVAATELAAMQVAIKTEYASIVASVPDSVKKAFNELNQ